MPLFLYLNTITMKIKWTEKERKINLRDIMVTPLQTAVWMNCLTVIPNKALQRRARSQWYSSEESLSL